MSQRTELQTIYDRHGYLTKLIVLDEVRAEPGAFPAAHQFIFHIGRRDAADAYYLARTGELIRSVKVKRRQADSEGEVDIRQWHAVRLESGDTFRSIEDVEDDPFLAKLIARDLERQWRQLWTKAQQFETVVRLIREDVAG